MTKLVHGRQHRLMMQQPQPQRTAHEIAAGQFLKQAVCGGGEEVEAAAGRAGADSDRLGGVLMPRICQFFGVVIYMYFNDHFPPHFPAEYGDLEAVYAIDTLDILRGELPRRAHSMVIEWALAHRPELRANWDRARDRLALEPIAPLD